MPSKLTGILSAGGLALITAEVGTSLYDVVNEHNMGVLIEPGSVVALVHGIKDSIQRDDIDVIKINARKYALQYLSKDAVLGSFEEKLLSNR